MKHPMLWLAGADEEVLAQCPERERTKQVGVGGTVLTTAVLAVLAATYVVHARLGAPLAVSILVGLGWGAAIMNLDRWLQVTLRRQRTVWLTVATGVPRVLLAVIVGFVISEPLVLAIYHNEVNARAQRNQDAKLTAGLNNLGSTAEIKQLKQERDELQKGLKTFTSGEAPQSNPEYEQLKSQLEVMQRHLVAARHDYQCAVDGSCPGGARAARIKGQVVRQLATQVKATGRRLTRFGRKVDQQAAARAEAADEAANARLVTLATELKEQQVLYDKAAAGLRKRYSHIGLLDQEEALSDLTSANGSLRFNRFMLQLLIICLDSLPVLVKLMLLIGHESAYDRLIEHADEVDYENAVGKQDARAEATRIESQIIVEEATVRHERQRAALGDLIKQVVDAQKAVAERWIAQWRAQMLAAGDGQFPPPAGGNGKSAAPNNATTTGIHTPPPNSEPPREPV